MKLNKDNIKPEDRDLAISVRNHLVNGQFVIGNPGLGLKKTLLELEKRRDNRDFGVTDWVTKDSVLNARISATKAGIEGEINLCNYLSRLLKYDKDLQGIVAFASLSYEQEDNDKDYIPDTDTLLVYGRNLLVVDAKNLKTKQNKPLRIEDGWILDSDDKEILYVKPSTYIWRNIMRRAGIQIDSIDGYVCIVNDTETTIERTDEWYESETKLIHIRELRDELHTWIDGHDNTLYLALLTEIAKSQIREEHATDIDFATLKKMFGL